MMKVPGDGSADGYTVQRLNGPFPHGPSCWCNHLRRITSVNQCTFQIDCLRIYCGFTQQRYVHKGLYYNITTAVTATQIDMKYNKV